MANYNEFDGHFVFPKGEGKRVHADLVAEIVRRKNEVLSVSTRVNLALRAQPLNTTPEQMAQMVRDTAGADAAQCWLNVVLGDQYYKRARVAEFTAGNQPEAARLVALRCKPSEVPAPAASYLFFPGPEDLRIEYDAMTVGTGEQGTWGVEFAPGFDRLSLKCDKNNHVVERVRKSPVFRFLMARLDQVPWTPMTGGSIYYRDEYSAGWKQFVRKGIKPVESQAPSMRMS